MGVTAVAAGVVQSGLPFQCSYGKTKTCLDRKRMTLALHPTITCCSSSLEGADKKPSSSSSSSFIISNEGNNLHSYFQSFSAEKPHNNVDGDQEWDWGRWQEHFSQVDEQESLLSLLKFQLEEAIQSEDFQAALRLKTAIAETTGKDTVAEVMVELKRSIEEERYSDASRLRDEAGAGLVGWWVGLPEGSNVPYGRIIRITPAQGRFLAKSYSARQLAAAGPGVPLFEIFITKDGDFGYKKQAVYIKPSIGTSGDSLQASKAVDASLLDSPNSVSEENNIDQGMERSVDVESDGDKSDDKDLMDDGLNRVLSFLKDKIPDIKFNILKVTPFEGAEMDKKIFEKLIEGDGEEKDESSSSEISEDEIKIEDDLEDDQEAIEESDSIEKRREIPIIVIDGTLESISEDKAPRVVTRVPAKVEYKGRDSFVFHPKENENREQDDGKEESDLKEATIAAQASTDLMPPDVEKVLIVRCWNVKKGRSKVSEIKGMIKLSMNDLFKSTEFQRINVAEANANPFSGLYIGAFGRYISELVRLRSRYGHLHNPNEILNEDSRLELVQLRSRYGHWHNPNEILNEDSRLEFFEYVEAVKLTGDSNVPAGQVTFRAKIGKENRISNRGIYPEDLGVIARYNGQVRVAEAGSQNPQWIDGELVLLNGKGSSLAYGAELGFAYSVPERHILMLFNRLKLQE